MSKLLIVALVVVLILIGGIAVALKYYFGWQGLLAFPLILYVLIRVGRKIAGGFFKGFMQGLLFDRSDGLRGAVLTVHSVVSIPAPLDSEDEPADERPAKEPKHYYAVDLTIAPRDPDSGELWEPGELILTSQKISALENVREHEMGIADEVLIWRGSVFGPDDPGKYAGAQRLKVTFAVKPGTSKAWLQYYNEAIGELELPPWTSRDEPRRKRLTQRTARAARDSVVQQSDAERKAAKQARRGANFKNGAGQPVPELTLYELPNQESDESIDPELPMAQVDAALDRLDARRLDGLSSGASRFGGVPDLPRDLSWPVLRGRKLPFLAQIDLAELPKSVLPPDGWLFAFGLCHDDHRPMPIRVLYHQGPRAGLARAARPSDREIWEDWTGNHIYSVVPLKVAKEKGLEDCGQLFGKIDHEGEDAVSIADGEGCSGDDWVTLMIIPSVGSMMWSDCGLLHIVIRREDLAKHDFTKVCAGLSCVG